MTNSTAERNRQRDIREFLSILPTDALAWTLEQAKADILTPGNFRNCVMVHLSYHDGSVRVRDKQGFRNWIASLAGAETEKYLRLARRLVRAYDEAYPACKVVLDPGDTRSGYYEKTYPHPGYVADNAVWAAEIAAVLKQANAARDNVPALTP
jgi:hypothetical protein